jgi:uncharacterized glyoxalase superfamily protein PhnB
MSMKRVIHGIIVKDVEAAKAFYTEHLDARVIFDAGWYVSLRIGGREGPEVAFAVPHHDQDRSISPGTLSLYVEVDDADAAHLKVSRTGAPIDSPPSDKPWGDRSFMLSDPNGVRVYVFSPRPMSPEFAACVKE